MSDFAGIDLGNSRTKVAIFDAGGNPTMLANPDGDLCTPSDVYFSPEGEIIVGEQARSLGLVHPDNFVTNWKRHMGTDKVLYIDRAGKEFRAKNIAAIILGFTVSMFKARTGMDLAKAVVSVPANYTDNQKAETEEAARAVGIEPLALVHEPTAALFGNTVHRRADGTYLVVDLGGSTLDVTVADVSGNNIEVKTTNGDPDSGGQDFSRRLFDQGTVEFESQTSIQLNVDEHPQECHDLMLRTELAKIALTTREKTSVVIAAQGNVANFNVDRAQFEAATTDLVEPIIRCIDGTLSELGIDMASIVEIIPVGGASMMPMIADAIENRFGRRPTTHCEPHFAVALGNVVAGRLEMDRQSIPVYVGEVRLPPLGLSARDVTAHPIGVCVLDENGVLINDVIIPKSTRMPSDQTKKYKLAEPGQTDVFIQLLQGPDKVPQDKCLALGHFELSGMTAVNDRDHIIEIRFQIDRNGVLRATAYDPLSGVEAELQLDYKNGGQVPAPTA